MSSRRSRSGGRRIPRAERRWKSGARTVPASMARSRSASVAASTRTSAFRPFWPPMGWVSARLQHAEQHDLHVGRGLADLVEEEGAALCALRSSHPAASPRPCRRRARPRELGGRERRRDRADVDRHEGRGAPGARVVNAARHELLPGPGLAPDEHGKREIGDAPDVAAHSVDALALPDEAEGGVAHRGDAAAESLEHQHHAAPELQDGAAPQRLGSELDRAVRGTPPHGAWCGRPRGRRHAAALERREDDWLAADGGVFEGAQAEGAGRRERGPRADRSTRLPASRLARSAISPTRRTSG